MPASRTELILDRAHNAVISMDQLGRVSYWNPSAERTFRIRREEAVGRRVADLIVPERFREAHEAGLRWFLGEGVGPMLDRRVELTALRRDRTEFPVELTISGVQQDGEWIFTAFVQDISERQAGERERLVEELRRALLGSERRFEAIVGSLSDPVTIRDREDRIIYANRAALSHLGFESLEELRGTSPERIMGFYDVFAADGSEISMSEVPSVRLLRGEPAEPLLIRAIDRRTGVERWSLLKAAPVLDEAGELEATIMFTEDVTEQKRAERRAEFLARASEVLASSLDYEQTLRNVARLAVPDVVDWCAVDLLDADGDRVSVAVAHADLARLELAQELRAYEPEQPDPDQGLGLVLRTGEPVLYPEITDEMLVAIAANERQLELLRSIGFRSAAVVPMRIGSRTLGAMTFVSAESGRVLGRSDVELAEPIAARAAVAIENSRIYSERSEIAHTLQQSPCPRRFRRSRAMSLRAFTSPRMRARRSAATSTTSGRRRGAGWLRSAMSPAKAPKRRRSSRWCATRCAPRRNSSQAPPSCWRDWTRCSSATPDRSVPRCACV
jgi:PAS domain S-box-containing protein